MQFFTNESLLMHKGSFFSLSLHLILCRCLKHYPGNVAFWARTTKISYQQYHQTFPIRSTTKLI